MLTDEGIWRHQRIVGKYLLLRSVTRYEDSILHAPGTGQSREFGKAGFFLSKSSFVVAYRATFLYKYKLRYYRQDDGISFHFRQGYDLLRFADERCIMKSMFKLVYHFGGGLVHCDFSLRR
jgi:hypothetical protein